MFILQDMKARDSHKVENRTTIKSMLLKDLMMLTDNNLLTQTTEGICNKVKACQSNMSTQVIFSNGRWNKWERKGIKRS